MEKKGLVSLITPCHNSSGFIRRLLDSVLEQSYEKIEMVTVDNASEDNTPDIIKSYMPKFEAKGYTLSYFLQDDLGPSAGIQTGLRVITGEYLLMPDSDDWYAGPKSIETFVNKFKELSDEYAIIRCQQNFVDEETMKTIGISYQDATEDDPGTLFEDCLFGRNGYNFAPINYMVRVSALRKETGLNIYNAYNTGQQRQICMPLYYKYKTWTILKPLVCYLVRNSSVSHGEYSKYLIQKKLYNQTPEYIDSILSCIDTMPEQKKEYYRNAFLQMETKSILKKAFLSGNKNDIQEYLDNYRKYGGNPKILLHTVKKEIIFLKLKKLVKKALRLFRKLK